MKNIYNIADVKILIENNFDYTFTERYRNFLEDTDKYDVVYKFKSIDKNIKFKTKPICTDISLKIYCENGEVFRVLHRERKNSEYLCMMKDKDNKNTYNCYIYNNGEQYLKTDRDIFNALGIEKLLNDFGVIYLHSSFIKYKGVGILFTGPSGIGKSTQASLWNKYQNADIINGDRALVKRKNGEWFAYGSPYAGSSELYVNDSAFIKSIVVLRQSNQNKIERLSEKEAFKLIFSETTVNFWDSDFVNKVVDLVIQLVKDVPVYILYCRPDDEAVELLKKEIKKGCEYNE